MLITSPILQPVSFRAHPLSPWWVTRTSQSMPSGERICETSQNLPRTFLDQKLSCSSRTIARLRTFSRQPMLLFPKTLTALRKTFGPTPAMAKRLSLSQDSTSELKLPTSLIRSLSFEMHRLRTETWQFCIEPTHYLPLWKRNSRASGFLMRLLGDSSSTSVKKSRTPLLT